MRSYIAIRAVRLILTVAVAVSTLTVVAQATQTITVPNAANAFYNLAPGGITGAIAVSPNVPVHVMGVCLTLGFRGVGQVSLLSIPGSFLEWVGLESTAGSTITQGFSGVTGTHIVFLDFAHQVDVEVNNSTSIRVHNTSTGVRSGRVTLIW
jgi:hypothetical protein